MSTNLFCKAEVLFIASLFFLAGGVLSLRFHSDFFAGFGICAGVAMVAISTGKRYRAS